MSSNVFVASSFSDSRSRNGVSVSVALACLIISSFASGAPATFAEGGGGQQVNAIVAGGGETPQAVPQPSFLVGAPMDTVSDFHHVLTGSALKTDAQIESAVQAWVADQTPEIKASNSFCTHIIHMVAGRSIQGLKLIDLSYA